MRTHIYQPFCMKRIQHKVKSKSSTGLNSGFFFSKTGCHSSAWWEMQTASSRVWTQFNMSISYHDIHYTTSIMCIYANTLLIRANVKLELKVYQKSTNKNYHIHFYSHYIYIYLVNKIDEVYECFYLLGHVWLDTIIKKMISVYYKITYNRHCDK